MKKLLLSFAIFMTINHATFALDTRPFFDNDKDSYEWLFLEKTFITDINQKKQWWNQATNYAALASALGFSLSGANGLNTQVTPLHEHKDILKVALEPKNAYTIFSGLTIAYSVNEFIHAQATKSINYQVVAHFFANWDNNQYFIPEELEEGFQTIADSIQEEGHDFIAANADKIVDIIQFFVKRHFEKRYDKLLQLEALSLTSGDVKTMTDIVKNSIESVSKLGSAGK